MLITECNNNLIDITSVLSIRNNKGKYKKGIFRKKRKPMKMAKNVDAFSAALCPIYCVQEEFYRWCPPINWGSKGVLPMQFGDSVTTPPPPPPSNLVGS